MFNHTLSPTSTNGVMTHFWITGDADQPIDQAIIRYYIDGEDDDRGGGGRAGRLSSALRVAVPPARVGLVAVCATRTVEAVTDRYALHSTCVLVKFACVNPAFSWWNWPAESPVNGVNPTALQSCSSSQLSPPSYTRSVAKACTPWTEYVTPSMHRPPPASPPTAIKEDCAHRTDT